MTDGRTSKRIAEPDVDRHRRFLRVRDVERDDEVLAVPQPRSAAAADVIVGEEAVHRDPSIPYAAGVDEATEYQRALASAQPELRSAPPQLLICEGESLSHVPIHGKTA